MRSNVIDIIERFQARHALQEERETQNSHASNNGSVSSGVPDENGRSKAGIFEMEEVRGWTVAVPSGTEWLAPHDGRDRMVVTLGRTRQLPADRDSAFPARWACVPANSDFKVPNETYHTRNFMIVEFNNANNSHETTPEEKGSAS
jgi:hypothetical protein